MTDRLSDNYTISTKHIFAAMQQEGRTMGKQTGQFAIYHKRLKAWFAGWDVNENATWGSEHDAKRFRSRLVAESQALLFARNDDGVQKRAKVLA